MDTWIRLPYGGKDAGFYAKDLLDHIEEAGRDYIIQGQIHCKLSNHRKPNSLDVWLRQGYIHIKDTKQAVNAVIADLVATGLFDVQWGLVCPDSGRRCKGLRLTSSGRISSGTQD